MTSQTLGQFLSQHPFFEHLDADSVALVAGCARNVHFRASATVFREDDPADTFYAVRSGRIALTLHSPTGPLIVDNAGAGEVVGWSWLVPPYRWTFGGQATGDCSAVALDGACLRGKCEQDPALGYALLQQVVGVMSERIHSARLRLLDLYGNEATR